jgi:hypothetical protein
MEPKSFRPCAANACELVELVTDNPRRANIFAKLIPGSQQFGRDRQCSGNFVPQLGEFTLRDSGTRVVLGIDFGFRK